jgi:two-component system sensor histidine kinase MtrB
MISGRVTPRPDSGWRRLPPVRLASWARWRWRRSLPLRVVTSALVVSLAVVALFGVFLLDRITKGQLRSQRIAAESEFTGVLRSAQTSLLSHSERTDDDLTAVLTVVRDNAPSDAHFELVRHGGASLYFPPSAHRSDVPDELRDLVRNTDNGAKIGRAYSTMTVEGSRVPALVLGSEATPTYDIYMLLPLTSQVDTWLLVRRSLLVAGTGFALLISLVVLLVTRQVVTPVTHAARIAERFAAGEFAERMNVDGEDEMARLAETFNRMAANLQQKIGELQELSRVQRRFVADVSHELRTPLTTVRMAADILYAVRQDFAPEISRSAELLQNELDRFEGLLVDLLEISRYDAGAAVLEPELIDMRSAVQRVIEAVAPLAERRGSDVVVQTAGTGRLFVEADPRRLQRILRNLIFNAVEHGEGLPVHVTIGADQQAVAVVVRDLGVGFRPVDAARVFSRFWRADPSRARQTGGTGLGLSIALEDARLHGGWLQAWGQPGHGAVFRLTLPRQAGGELVSSPLPLEQPTVMTDA